MKYLISASLPKIARDLLAFGDDSQYVNIPIYDTGKDLSDPGSEAVMSIPSMYEVPPEQRVRDHENRIERQGPFPGPVTSLQPLVGPGVSPGNPFENAQGEVQDYVHSDSQPKEVLDRDTVPFDEGLWINVYQ